MGSSWIGGVPPGPSDVAVIKGLKGSGMVFLDSDYADSIFGLTTDSTVNLQVENGSLSLGVDSSSTIGGPMTVETNASLNVGGGATVVVSDGQTLSDAGTLSFSDGDTVTLDDGCCPDAAQISVSGILNASDTTFAGDSSTSVTFTSTGEINGGTNIFDLPLIVPYTDISSLAGNTSFEQIKISAGTLSSGTVSLDSIGSDTTKLSYVFPDGFMVASGGTLAVGANVPVVVSDGQTLSDAGTLSFSDGDMVTLDDGCCPDAAQISVSGSLSANGTAFTGDSSTGITFASTGVISGGTNTFNVPLIVPYTDVSSLSGNTSFEQIEISAATLSSGTLSLNSIGTTTTKLSYLFPDGFTVASGATLAVGANVPVVLSDGQTLSDAGTLSFSSGDTVTLNDGCCPDAAHISVSGSLTANATTFTGDGSTSVTFTSTGVFSGGTNIFNLPLIVPYTDVSALSGNTSLEQIEISSGTLSSGTLSLNSIGTTTTNLSYVFPDGFTVASGGTLAVGANVLVALSDGQTLSDAGLLSFSSGDTVTLDDGCCPDAAKIVVSGSLTANGTTFNGDSSTDVTFTSTGAFSGGTNIFNLPLVVFYTDVSSLSTNTSFEQINISSATLSSGTLSLNSIGTTTTNLSYVFPDGFTVASGGMLAVGANVPVSLSDGQTLFDAGTMSFSSGDTVTLNDGCCPDAAHISVSGSMIANGATFTGDSSTSITFTSTGVFSGGTNIFNLSLIVPYTDVSSLSSNTSFEQIEISSATLSSGTLSLNSIGSNMTNLSYVFPGGFTVGSGGTLDVGVNVPIVLSDGQTLSDAGTLSFSSGDTVTLNDGCCPDAAKISVSGNLTASGTTFTGDSSTSITLTSTGMFSGGTNIFNAPLILPFKDVSTLTGNTSFEQIEISSGTLFSGTLSLNLIGTNTTNLSYVFPAGFTVANGAILAVSANVAVVLSPNQTLSDAGTVSFSSGDVVTVDNGAQISVSGTLHASNVTFTGGGAREPDGQFRRHSSCQQPDRFQFEQPDARLRFHRHAHDRRALWCLHDQQQYHAQCVG